VAWKYAPPEHILLVRRLGIFSSFSKASNSLVAGISRSNLSNLLFSFIGLNLTKIQIERQYVNSIFLVRILLRGESQKIVLERLSGKHFLSEVIGFWQPIGLLGGGLEH
jgi:hypothetical protein